MAVIFMDSFQHYLTADLTKKWTTSSASINTTAGRRGGGAMTFGGGGQASTKVFSQAYGALIAGFAIKPLAANLEYESIAFQEGGTSQISIRYAADGVVSVWRGPTKIGESAPGKMNLNVWSYLEINAIFHNTAGAIEVRVNGQTVINLSGIDTTQTANNYVTAFLFSTPVHSFNICDLYILDPGTAPNTTFLGDVRVDAYFPTGDGGVSQWTPTPSGVHYVLVDETAPNETDYIEADVTGYVDTFAVQDLAVAPAASEFYAVQICAAAKKTDAGSRQLKGVIRIAATNYAGAAKDVSETQQYALTQFNTNPATAVAWTKAGFDAAEFGVELV